jgi:hypothetical protein
LTVECTDSTWIATDGYTTWQGTYTRNGNTATFTQTNGAVFGTASVSGNTMTVNERANGDVFRLQKQSGSTPGGGSGTGGTFTLTGIPAQYNGKWATIEAGNDSVGLYLYGAQSVNASTSAYTASPISGGSVSIPMWKPNSSYTTVTRYSGNDTCGVIVWILETANHVFFDEDEDEDEDVIAGVGFYSVTFSNGSAARSWNQGDNYR